VGINSETIINPGYAGGSGISILFCRELSDKCLVNEDFKAECCTEWTDRRNEYTSRLAETWVSISVLRTRINELVKDPDKGNRQIVAPGMKNSSPEAGFTETEREGTVGAKVVSQAADS